MTRTSLHQHFRRASLVGAAALTSVGVIATGAAPAGAVGVAGAAGAATYRHYTNGRFGFTTLRPASFRATPPPADGDGREWTTRSGTVTLTTYGENNVLHTTVRSDLAADAKTMRATYDHISGRVVTVSGFRHHGKTIVYERDVVGHGSIDTLLWTYPTSEGPHWAAAVTRTAGAFKAGNVAKSH